MAILTLAQKAWPRAVSCVGVGLGGPARDQVEQARVHPPLGVAGQVHHPGQLLRSAPALVCGLGRHVVPQVLIDPQGRHTLEAGRVLVPGLQDRT